MDIGYHGDGGGPLPGFNDRRISGLGAVAQQQSIGTAELQKLAQASAKDSSPVERELNQLNANVKNLFNEVETLSRQLIPVLVPASDNKAQGESSGIGVGTSPLHRSLYGANVQLTKLAQQVAQLRSSLSI